MELEGPYQVTDDAKFDDQGEGYPKWTIQLLISLHLLLRVITDHLLVVNLQMMLILGEKGPDSISNLMIDLLFICVKVYLIFEGVE